MGCSKTKLDYAGRDIARLPGMATVTDPYDTHGFEPDDSAAHAIDDVLSPSMRFSGFSSCDCSGTSQGGGTGRILGVVASEYADSGSPINGSFELWLTTEDPSTVSPTPLPAQNAAFAASLDPDKVQAIIDLAVADWKALDSANAILINRVGAPEAIVPPTYITDSDHLYGFIITKSADTYNASGLIKVDLIVERN